MAASVPAKEFRAAAKFAASVTQRKSTVPILATVRLAMDGDALALTGTNLDNTAIVRVPVTGKVKPICFPARQLAAIAASLDGEIKIDGASLAANGTRYELTEFDAKDFPEEKSVEWGEPIMAVPEFRRGLSRAAFAVSKEETRYYLNGVYFRPGVAAATDGHRLARVALNGNGADFKPIIFPRAAIPAASAMPHATDADVRTCEHLQLKIREGDYQLVSRLIDGTFPDYERVIPDAAAAKARFTVQSSDLMAALRRISPMCFGRNPPVKFEIEGATLVLSAQHHAFGKAVDRVDLEVAIGDPLTIGFNHGYVADICRQGMARMHWHITDAGSACRIETDDGPLFVLMPMRV